MRLDNGVTCWALLSAKYVLEAVTNTEQCMKEALKINAFPKTRSGPWPTGYVPEQDNAPELDPKQANYCQSMVGVLHLMVELGRVNVITETSVLASHMALPREGHLDAALHVFGYLKKSTMQEWSLTQLTLILTRISSYDMTGHASVEKWKKRCQRTDLNHWVNRLTSA